MQIQLEVIQDDVNCWYITMIKSDSSTGAISFASDAVSPSPPDCTHNPWL